LGGAERLKALTFKDRLKFDRKPAKLLENRCNVIDGWNPGDDAGGRVLDQLELMDGLVGGTKELSCRF